MQAVRTQRNRKQARSNDVIRFMDDPPYHLHMEVDGVLILAYWGLERKVSWGRNFMQDDIGLKLHFCPGRGKN